MRQSERKWRHSIGYPRELATLSVFVASTRSVPRLAR
jgi:hypothetical protein